MKLSTRILLILAAAFVGLFLVMYGATRTVVERAFSEVEHRNMRSGVNSMTALYDQELDDMVKRALRWASGDELVEFAAGISDRVPTNLVDGDGFVQDGVNLVVVADAGGEILSINAYDSASGRARSVPDYVRSFVARDSFLRRHHHALSRIQGLVLFPDGPMLTVSVPILPDREGSLIHGALIVGRWWDNARFAAVMQKAEYSIYQQSVQASMGSEFRAVHDRLRQGAPLVIDRLREATLAAYVLLDNVYGEPALIVRLSRPRHGALAGNTAFTHVAIVLLVTGALILLAAVLAVELTVSRRMRQLLREVSLIESNEHISLARISIRGRDEIGRIAAGMRYVLSALRVNRFRWLRTEKQLQKTLAATPAGVMFVDQTNSTVTRINQAALTILEAAQEDILAQPAADIIERIDGIDAFDVAAQKLTAEAEARPARLRKPHGGTVDVLLNGCDVRVEQEHSLLISFIQRTPEPETAHE